MNNLTKIFVTICVLKLCFAISNFEPFKQNHFKVDQINQNFENEIRQLGKNFTEMSANHLFEMSANNLSEMSANLSSEMPNKHLNKRSVESSDYSQMSERSNDKSGKSKRSIDDHYEDSHCFESFETSDKTIIRTIESKSNGAVFLNNTEVETYERCLRFCCQTNQCTVAVWDQQVSFNGEIISLGN